MKKKLKVKACKKWARKQKEKASLCLAPLPYGETEYDKPPERRKSSLFPDNGEPSEPPSPPENPSPESPPPDRKVMSYLFHEYPSAFDPCWSDREIAGCNCGGNSSQWSLVPEEKSWNSTQPEFFTNRGFVFGKNPRACIRFLALRRDEELQKMCCLTIRCKENPVEREELREVFHRFGKNLHLWLLYLVIESSPAMEQSGPPLYTRLENIKNIKYTPLRCPPRHPLSELTGLRNLVVCGYPGPDIRDAVFNLARHMKIAGDKSGTLMRSYFENDVYHFGIWGTV